MAPRGLKNALRKTAPAILKRNGSYKTFQSKKTEKKLRGLTKLLEKHLWSKGVLPVEARRADVSIRDYGTWKGEKGGQYRGMRVDQQLTRLINGGGPAVLREGPKMLKLTKMALSALARRGLKGVLAQRSTLCEAQGVGTAADILAYDKKKNVMVVVEVKCGYDRFRTASAVSYGRDCKMQAPCSRASDCNVHRHMAQLAVTHLMLSRERDMLKQVGDLGISQELEGVLLYVNDEGAEFHPLTEWWQKKAPLILRGL